MSAWSIITGPLGKALAVVVAVVAIYMAGYNARGAVAQAEGYRGERDVARRDLSIGETMAGEANSRKTAADEKREARNEKVRDYAARNGKSDACLLTDDDIEQLRNIVR